MKSEVRNTRLKGLEKTQGGENPLMLVVFLRLKGIGIAKSGWQGLKPGGNQCR